MLGRKLFRELKQQKGQTAAVLVVVGLGVTLFIASAGAYIDLRDSYAATRDQLALADLHVDVDRASDADVATVERVLGVASAALRTVTMVPATIGKHRVELRVLSLPDQGDPALDRVLLLTGNMPEGADEILLEKHVAQHHHLAPGDTIALATEPARTVRVAGIAVSAEYLWVARSQEDFFTSPDAFGVGWMRASAVPAGSSSGSQLLVDLDRGAVPSDVAREITVALGANRVSHAVPADQLVGVRLLQLDVDGYQGMAAFFPIFFLGVGAFIVASILARLVDAQRPLIGTLTALGVGRARILGHYLAYGVVLGATGALLGAVAGIALEPLMTQAYATELGIPFVTTRAHVDLAAWGTLLGVGVCALAALVPAIHASRETPAAAMRPPRPSTGALARLARRLPAPLPIRMAVRDVLGRPLRSVATALGIAAALVVVITTGGLLDSMKVTFASTFEHARRDDARIDLAGPEPLGEIEARFGALDGVVRVEGIIAAPQVLDANGRHAEALVQGLADDAALVRSVDSDGTVVPPPKGGIVLTRGLARTLAVHRGDTVTIHGASFQVAGYADAALGPVASIRRIDAAQRLGLGERVNQVALSIDPTHRDAVRDTIAGFSDVAHVEDTAAVRTQVNELMGLGWVMLGLMLAFGSVLAAAILFNTATLGVLERRRDLATLRALGRTNRELGLGLTIEHLLLAALGVAIGVPVALAATRRLTTAFSSELFSLPYVVSTSTLAVAIGGTVGVLLLAQWPALRTVARMSLADAVRTREG